MATDAEREEKIHQFAQLQGQIVADALRANPPVVTLPESVTQALLQMAAKLNAAPTAGPLLDPITQLQQNLQLQQQQNTQQGRLIQVSRYDANGLPVVQATTVPQLLAEIADLMHAQCRLLEETVRLLDKKKGR